MEPPSPTKATATPPVLSVFAVSAAPQMSGGPPPTIPFAPTAAVREAWRDARPSIEERYATREEFLAHIRAAALLLADDGYLLKSDIDDVVATSARRYDEFIQLHSPLP